MNGRYCRQTFLGPDSQQTIREARIGIAGLCGGGSHVAQQLAHIGFRDFVISDFDRVEDPNLNRMVGATPPDAASSETKTAVIERLIKAINPEARVTTIQGKWQEQQLLLRDRTAIFGCVDTFAARDELERFCRRYLTPYIDVGMDVHKVAEGFAISGQVILSLPDAPCMRCLGLLTDERIAEEQQRYGAAGAKPQVIWPNGVLASGAVGQLMALLLPWNAELRPSLMLEYDGNRQIVCQSSKLDLLEQQPCPHFSGAHALGDPWFAMV